MHILNYIGNSLYFDLDIEIHDNIDFLADDFEHFTVVDSRRCKKTKRRSFKVSNNTFINSSVMRYLCTRHISKICKQ